MNVDTVFGIHSIRTITTEKKRSKDVEEIVQTISIPKKEIIAKWNILRAQFSREVHMELKIKSGEASEERYTSKWKFLGMMKFLTPVVQTRKSTDNLFKEEIETVGEVTEPKHKEKKPKKSDTKYFKAELLSKAVDILNQPAELPAKSETLSDKFATYVGQKLESFSARRRLIAEKQISDVLFNFEMESFEDNRPVSSPWLLNGPPRNYQHYQVLLSFPYPGSSSSPSDSSCDLSSPPPQSSHLQSFGTVKTYDISNN